MKRLISLLLLVFVVLGGGYLGLWYYGCMRLEKKLSKSEFNLAFGPDKAVTMVLKLDRTPARYVGWQRGAVGVEFGLKSGSSTASVQLPQHNERQVQTMSFSAGEKPLVSRVSVPFWGSSLTLEAEPFDELRYDSKMGGLELAMLQSGDAYRVRFDFRDTQLALTREKQIDAIIADPKRIVDDIAGVDLVFKGKTLNARDKAVMVEGTFNGGGLHWTIGADGMLNVRYDLDMEAHYGPGFAEWFQIAPPNTGLPGVSEEQIQRFQKLQQALIGGASFVTKGAIEVTLPANRVGLREQAAAADTGFPVPPLEIKFERFKFRFPFILSSLMSLDGTAGFMWKGAKPISIDISQDSDAQDVERVAESITKIALESPEFKAFGIDASRTTPNSLVSLNELVSEQGAYVLIRSSLQALSKAFFGHKAHSAVKVDVKTAAGNANVFELMGASATWAASAKLENGVGWELNGSAEGAKSWRSNVAIYELSKFLRELRAPLMMFAARSAIPLFVPGDGSAGLKTGATAQQEKEFLEFVFSDELFEDLLAALGRVLRVIDQTPDSASDLNLLVEGSAVDLSINGMRIQQLEQALSAVVKQEVQALLSKLQPRLASLKVVQQADPEHESEEQDEEEEEQQEADVEWQRAPTREGDASAKVIR